MAAVAVSPATVGSPGPELSPQANAPSHFDAIHVSNHVQSDWNHFYGSATDEDEELYRLMEDLAHEIITGMSSRAGENERPKWVIDSSGPKDVKISFDSSEDTLWTVAIDEIKAYRERICKLKNLSFDEIDPIKHILELFLGKSKPLMQLLESELGVSYEKACHFLGTYCVHKAWRVSVSEMYDNVDHDRVRSNAEGRVHSNVDEDCGISRQREGRTKEKVLLGKVPRPFE